MKKNKPVATEKHEDVVITSLYVAKSNSALARGIPFLLSFDDYKNIKSVTHCAYSGVMFDKKSDAHSMTIERIDPKKPYIASNCVAVTAAANNLKSNLDMFMHGRCIPNEMKIKLLRKAVYALEKELKNGKSDPAQAKIEQGMGELDCM